MLIEKKKKTQSGQVINTFSAATATAPHKKKTINNLSKKNLH